MTDFLTQLKRLDAEAFCIPWKADSDGDICAISEKPKQTEYGEALPTVCTSAAWRGPDDPNMALICLLRNNTAALIELVEAAERSIGLMCKSGKHANEGCFDCQVAIALAKLKGGS